MGIKKSIVTTIALLGLAAPLAMADPVQPVVVSAVPTAKTPWILDGTVNAVLEVGSVTLAGGTFTQVSAPNGTAATANKLVAFDATGTPLPGFDAGLDGDVYALAPGPSDGTVYVGGQFTTAGGIVSRRVALLDASTGRAIAGFKSAGFDGVVRDLERAGSRLVVGGTFATAGGVAHSGLATLNATTGALDPYLTVQLTEHHNNSGTGAQAPIGAFALDVSPDATKLAVVGNFRKANGADRVQAVLVNLGATATVADWATDAFVPLCSYRSFDTYVRDVAFNPDGRFFVIVTTGGGYAGTYCDSATRWDVGATGTGLAPTWSDVTGGDTLLSVAASGTAVYVGGHQRWLNNPNGIDRAGSGAVARPGLAALDPDSGLPLSWNPGRNPRGMGASALTVTDGNLWVGSDTEWIGNYLYKRPRLAQFRVAGGAAPASDALLSLPGRVFVAGRSGSGTGLSATAFTGTDTGAGGDVPAMGLDWTKVRGAFYAGGQLFYGWSTGTMYRRSFNGAVLGQATELNPYHDPVWMSVDTGSGNTYDGSTVTFYGQLPSITGMTYAGDRIYYTRSGNDGLFWRWFNVDSGVVGANENVLTTSGFGSTKGLFYADGVLYQVTSPTTVVKRSLAGTTLGTGATLTVGSDLGGTATFVGPVPSQPPAAVAGVTCANLVCTVDATRSSDPEGGALTYSWDFGDGTPAQTTATGSHTYADPGSYTIRLTVTDPTGMSGSSTTPVTVKAPPTAPVAAAAADCKDLRCTLDASASTDVNGDALTYSWDFGDGSAAATGITTTHAYAAAGTYTVTLTVTDSTGLSATRAISVVASDPVAEVTHIASTATSGVTSAPAAAVPTDVRSGDLLLLSGTFASGSARPTAPAGWTVAGSTTSNGLTAYIWSKVASAGDAGTTVPVQLRSTVASTLTMSVYRGVSATAPIAQIAFATAWWSAATSPRLTSPGGGVLVEIYGSSSYGTADWSPPSGTTARVESFAEMGTSRSAAIVVDRPTSAGSVGGDRGSVSGLLNSTVAWSIELRR